MDNVVIRKIKADEIHILEDLLYESVYQPDGANPVPRKIIHVPEVRVYIESFGKKRDDHCMVADLKGKIIGGVWVRVLSGEIKGYGNVDDKTPEFAIAVFKKYRNRGTGKLLMKKMISHLKENGYGQASLSVQKGNYAVNMYKDLGFEIIDENEEDYIMLLKLGNLNNGRKPQTKQYSGKS